MELLAGGDRSVQQLADALPISRPAVSRHLRLLKEAGLVVEEPRGTRRIYRLHDEGIDEVRALPRARLGRSCGALPPGRREHGARAVIEPIRLAFEVHCPADHAFVVWTAGIAPGGRPTTRYRARPDLRSSSSHGSGGRIFERTTAGIEHDWGEVTVWEPPSRLVYLWHLRRDRADATEVEIRFRAQGEASTLVEIEHRGWEALGAEGSGLARP